MPSNFQVSLHGRCSETSLPDQPMSRPVSGAPRGSAASAAARRRPRSMDESGHMSRPRAHLDRVSAQVLARDGHGLLLRAILSPIFLMPHPPPCGRAYPLCDAQRSKIACSALLRFVVMFQCYYYLSSRVWCAHRCSRVDTSDPGRAAGQTIGPQHLSAQLGCVARK